MAPNPIGFGLFPFFYGVELESFLIIFPFFQYVLRDLDLTLLVTLGPLRSLAGRHRNWNSVAEAGRSTVAQAAEPCKDRGKKEGTVRPFRTPVDLDPD